MQHQLSLTTGCLSIHLLPGTPSWDCWQDVAAGLSPLSLLRCRAHPQGSAPSLRGTRLISKPLSSFPVFFIVVAFQPCKPMLLGATLSHNTSPVLITTSQRLHYSFLYNAVSVTQIPTSLQTSSFGTDM